MSTIEESRAGGRRIAVRGAREEDMASVADLYRHYVRHTVATFADEAPTADDWRARLAELAGRGLPFLVAEDGGEVAGLAYAAPWNLRPAYRHTVEDTVYLAPASVGRGLGRALLGELAERCGRAGVRQMIGVIATDAGDDGAAEGAQGAASLALHRALGFTESGRLRAVGHKHGRWLDTVLMQRALAPA